MRKILSVSVAALVAAMTACSPAAATPDAIAKDFLSKVAVMDFKGASALATDEGAAMLTSLEGMMALVPAEQLEAQKAEAAGKALTIINTEVNGETAVVTYKMGDEAEQTIDLKQVAGQWKVDFKKEMPGTGMDSSSEGTAETTETPAQ